MTHMPYTELQVTSNFSFLRGGSHPQEMIQAAADHGYQSIAVTDRNTLSGMVRAHVAAKALDVKLIVGSRLDLQDGPSLLVYPTDRESYARLSALLTVGNLRAEKGECHLFRQDVYEHSKGIKFIAIPSPVLNQLFDIDPHFEPVIKEYKEAFGRNLYIAATNYYRGDDAKRIARLASLSSKLSIPMVATNDVHYHRPERRELQDVLTCIREKCQIDNAGYKLNRNAEQHLKAQDEMVRLFKDYPGAIRNTQKIAEACQFSLSELRYEYPTELYNEGRSAQEQLVHLTWQGAKERFGITPPDIQATLEKELKFIGEAKYAPYFLTVHDIVSYANSEGILCQGRGSAANSAVCYCLGITSVDPRKFNLLFERFISSARNEPPDIDVDFAHRAGREKVIQYIYKKYGRHRAAIVATVTQEQDRSALTDVGKAMGLSNDTMKRLLGSLRDLSDDWIDDDKMKENGLNPADPKLRKVIDLSKQLLKFPRQLGMHTGGFVITDGPLSDLCPVMNARMEDRTTIEWNKDDIDDLGILKIDILALGMLTAISNCFDLAKQHYSKDYTLANIPQDDPVVYDMITAADTIGVFQIESRAQMSMLPRLKPRCFYDLVIEVAIVRPGPIQGNMVHPYLRRRMGKEPVVYHSKNMEKILSRTLGVPLFQEQAMQIAIDEASFTPAEADQLRRSMATFKFKGMVNQFEKKLVEGMMKNGHSQEFATQVFKQLEGFGSYGFPESHSASFASLVYVSSWLKCHYPDIFACGILNSLPMGFYHPAQLVIDARKHGVVVRPVDVNYSDWNNTLEEQDGKFRALRLGFRHIRGLRENDINVLTANRGTGYQDIARIWTLGVPQAALEKLADADAFNSIGLKRRDALWKVSALADKPAPLFEMQNNEAISEPETVLPVMQDGEEVVADYKSIALSLKNHPVAFCRENLNRRNVVPSHKLPYAGTGRRIKVAGQIQTRQAPPAAKGTAFITLEDEFGTINIVLFKAERKKYDREFLQSKMLLVEGTIENEENVIHIIAKKLIDLTPVLKNSLIPEQSTLPLFPLSRGDNGGRVETQVETALPQARNFR